MSVELYANLILIGLALLIAVSMVRFHNNEHYKHFNLIDLVTANDGKVSRPACMEMGAWIVLTWAFVVQVNKGTLTEWFAGIYVGSFVLRAAHSAYLSTKTGVETK